MQNIRVSVNEVEVVEHSEPADAADGLHQTGLVPFHQTVPESVSGLLPTGAE